MGEGEVVGAAADDDAGRRALPAVFQTERVLVVDAEAGARAGGMMGLYVPRVYEHEYLPFPHSLHS